MSMVLTRSPLEPIGMNGGSGPKRRSARLSAEGAEENEPPTKKGKTIVVGTKEQDGDSAAATKKKRKGKSQCGHGLSVLVAGKRAATRSTLAVFAHATARI